MPSLFEEQIEHDTNEIDRLFSLHRDSFGEASSVLPELDGYNSGVDRYLDLLEAAKAAIDVPVIASLNGTNIGGWLRYAQLLQDAGADAIELNLYAVAADPIVSGAALESEHFGLVALLADEITIPLAVKISPNYSSLSSFVVGLQEAGAAGVVMFNRFYLPDLDLETLDVTPRVALEHSRGGTAAAAMDGHPARAPVDVDRRIERGPQRLRRGKADPGRRRRGDDDVVVAPQRCSPTSRPSRSNSGSGCASTSTSRSTRCVGPCRGQRSPTRRPTSGPTTSATSRATRAASSAAEQISLRGR